MSRGQLEVDEEVLVDLRPHWVFFAAPALVTAAALAAAVVAASGLRNAPVEVAWVLAAMVLVPALWLGVRLAAWRSTSLVVTDRRLLLERGLVQREWSTVPLAAIADVRVEQSPKERLVGTGTLVVHRRDRPEPVVIGDVRRPKTLQRVLLRELVGVPDEEDGELDPTPPQGIEINRTYPARVPDPGPRDPTIPEQLIALDDLRRRGILTDAEFQDKKADLLSRL